MSQPLTVADSPRKKTPTLRFGVPDNTKAVPEAPEWGRESLYHNVHLAQAMCSWDRFHPGEFCTQLRRLNQNNTVSNTAEAEVQAPRMSA